MTYQHKMATKQLASVGTPVGTIIEKCSGTAHTPHGIERFSEWCLFLNIERNGRIEKHELFSGKKERMTLLEKDVKKYLEL